jgi:hypothetical protein
MYIYAQNYVIVNTKIQADPRLVIAAAVIVFILIQNIQP